MKAVIMAGGLGTRLRPLTSNLPKPMAPVVNKPILESIILHFKKYQIKEFILLLHYLPEKIKDYFSDGSELGVKINYILAEQDFATAGAVKLAEKLLAEPFLVFSSDGITNIDVGKLMTFADDKNSLATIALSRVPNPSPFGIATVDENKRITRFLEKPSQSQIFSDMVNMGIYVLHPKIFEFIPEKEVFYFARDLFPNLLQSGEPLSGYVHEGYWCDVGNLSSYQQVHWDIFNRKIDWDVALAKNCKLGKDFAYKGRIIFGNDCEIGDGALLKNCVLGDGCKIGSGTQLSRTILWNNVSVGDHSKLNKAIVASHSQIGEDVILEENVVVGDHVTIESGVRIKPHVRIWPGKKVLSGSTITKDILQ